MNSTHDLRSACWRKSSYSNAEGGECVEVANNFPGVMPVRDSKVPDGPILLLSPAAWTSFIRAAAK
ncbi:DUF397 domain-containing protein [Streptomyces sp. NPDC001401]|uniref:DUF397 domain-containing protein n=1 Tax=Streptomyces sp. NPDC001401 TaxID=3364570 RepID=UPI0036C72081